MECRVVIIVKIRTIEKKRLIECINNCTSLKPEDFKEEDATLQKNASDKE